MTKPILMFCAASLAVGGSLKAQPIITAVEDAGGYSVNIAQGSLFVVKGTNISGLPGINQAVSLPLPTLLANVRITVTPAAPGGSVQDIFMVYTYDVGGIQQLAAVMPSTLSPGDYDMRVVNTGATSSPFLVRVVPRKFGIITQDSSGTGNAVVQNFISSSRYDVNRLTSGTLSGSTITHSPSRPGQAIVIWGVGLGGVLRGADNIAPGVQDFRDRAAIRVLVGGQSITPDIYAGRAPEFAGTDEIILMLPNNVPTGCAVSLQVSVDGQPSNPATIAIAPAGADACVSSTFSRDTLARLDQGGSITVGSFNLSSFVTTQSTPLGVLNVKLESASGAFSRFTGAQFANATTFANEPGACQVFRRITDQSGLIFGGSISNLDAGPAITLEGPNVSVTNNQLRRIDGTNLYSLNLGTAINVPGVTPPPGSGLNSRPIIDQGTYILKGPGGDGVGVFEARLRLGPPVTISMLPSTINRSQALNLTWSGGAATDLVRISGISGATSSRPGEVPIYDAGVFVCTTTNTGSFSVPASVLSQLPPTPGGSAGLGLIMVTSTSVPSSDSGRFTAPLIGGGNIDAGLFLGTVGSRTTANYQ